MKQRGYWLDVSGDFACFTRPEFKVERISYDLITPSAARAIFESVFWKPAIKWVVQEIQVLTPIRWISIRRNEVGRVASTRAGSGFCIEDDGVRQQRAGLFLRDVRYRIRAEFTFIPLGERKECRNRIPEFLLETDFEAYSDWQKMDSWDVSFGKSDETEAKYAAMFERRAKKGQFFHKSFLGTRECAADVEWVGRAGKIDPKTLQPEPIQETRDLGWMLYDMDYTELDNIKPLFFRAKMDNGVIRVPDRNSDEVRG